MNFLFNTLAGCIFIFVWQASHVRMEPAGNGKGNNIVSNLLTAKPIQTMRQQNERITIM